MTSKPSGEITLWKKLEDFKRRNVSIEDKSYYSRKWEEGDKWNLSRSTEEEFPPWGSIDTWQVKPWEGVEENKEEDQTITPTIHEITYSRGTSSERTRDDEGSCRDEKERRIKTPSRDYHKG